MANPLSRFALELEVAEKDGIPLANSAVLGTVNAEGAPTSRVVLIKQVNGNGLDFFTNKTSRKGQHLAARPVASLCVHWPQLERQFVIEGTVQELSVAASDAYFASRPRESQLGAWASLQSQELPSRELLEQRFRDLAKQYDGKPVPRPEHWGGYRLTPLRFEFWQGAAHRLHHRELFERHEPTGAWKQVLLFP